MEYAGEVIRRSVADKREQQYTQQGLGLYFFALDRDYHIDATYKGNIARYINHSCWYAADPLLSFTGYVAVLPISARMMHMSDSQAFMRLTLTLSQQTICDAGLIVLQSWWMFKDSVVSSFLQCKR